MTAEKGELGVLEPDEDSVSVTKVDDVSTLQELTKAEVDTQVRTAKEFPRSISKFQDEVFALATLDQETADSMFYGFSRGGKWIEGPSVRFAEIVAYAWGNLRVEGRVIDVGRKEVTAQGIAWDLEKNIGSRIEVKRSILTKKGKRYSEDQVTVTANAAVKIAIRNAIFNTIPAALAKKAYQAALDQASGAGKSMEELRKEWVGYFTQIDAVDEKDVFRVLGVEGMADIQPEHIRHLKGLKNAIAEGSITIESAFADPKDQSSGAKDLEEELGGDDE